MPESTTASAGGSATRTMRRATNDEEKEIRRDEILAAAKTVFATNGFHTTTMADVAKEAGLSYGTVYWYFDSKEALFHALMDTEENALRRHIGQSIIDTALQSGEPDAAVSAMKTAVRATFEFFENDRNSVKLLFRDSYSMGEKFEKHLFGIYERFIDDIRVAIEAAQSVGRIVDMNPRMVAFSVAALIGQLAVRRLNTNDGMTSDAAAEFVVNLVLRGILPR